MKTKKHKIIKISSLFLTVIMMFSILACAPFTVSAAVEDDYSYRILEGEYAEITRYYGNDKNLVIPNELDGYPVVSIGKNAFYEEPIESVRVPNNVIIIDDGAFFGCANLKNIVLPNTVLSVGRNAFDYTKYYYTNSNWKNDILYVGKVACTLRNNKVKRISFEHGTITLADGIAEQCSELTALTIPDTVISIGEMAAMDCPKLKGITIPFSTALIGNYAFGFYTMDYQDYRRVSGFKVTAAKNSLGELYAEYYGFPFVDGSNAKSVSINRTSLTLGVGEEYTLITKITPSSGANYSWSSSNSSVAEVNGHGTVRAKKTGTSTITVRTANGLSKSCKVTVKAAPSSIKVSTSKLTLGVGEEFIISESTNSGSYAWRFNWSSSNTKVATVAKTSGNKAKIVAKGNGTADITVKTYNGKSATCRVTVKSAPTSVTLSNSSIILGKGENYIISQCSNSGSYARNFTWSSSNSKVATIEKTSGNKAKITAKSNGTATITFKTYNGKTATCKVNVRNAPSSVKTNPASVILGVGETYTVSESTNSGTYANADNLKWSSTNTSVATVTKGSGNKAQITAKRVGTAYVKITLYNGKTAQCKVTVRPAPTSVKLNITELMLKSGEKIVISESTNSGSYANSANLKWESSDSNVATVTKGSGNKAQITAKRTGVAVIKITTYNGKTALCTVYVNKTEDDIPEDQVQVGSSPVIIDDTKLAQESVQLIVEDHTESTQATVQPEVKE